MRPAEIDAIYRTAEEEFNAGEAAMLVSPIVVMGLIEDLRRCSRLRAEAGAYDQLAD